MTIFRELRRFAGVSKKNLALKLALMGLRPTQGDEKRLGQATTLYGTVALSLSSRPERNRISCHAALETTACAAFRKESRMKFANATNFNRKSGVAERRDLRFYGPFMEILIFQLATASRLLCRRTLSAFPNQQQMTGAPHLARFSRDVGYHEPEPFFR